MRPVQIFCSGGAVANLTLDLCSLADKIVSDPALWEVHAAEHVIFDSQLELAVASAERSS